jgi:hypothetical protein
VVALRHLGRCSFLFWLCEVGFVVVVWLIGVAVCTWCFFWTSCKEKLLRRGGLVCRAPITAPMGVLPVVVLG